MTDIIRLVLTNFWPFVAALILITTVCSGIAEIIAALRKKP